MCVCVYICFRLSSDVIFFLFLSLLFVYFQHSCTYSPNSFLIFLSLFRYVLIYAHMLFSARLSILNILSILNFISQSFHAYVNVCMHALDLFNLKSLPGAYREMCTLFILSHNYDNLEYFINRYCNTTIRKLMLIYYNILLRPILMRIANFFYALFICMFIQDLSNITT
jgi:hypothetical protein